MDSQNFWDAIDILAQRHKMSLTRLAKVAGLDPSSLSHSKRILANGNSRWLSTETLSKVLHALDTSLSEFVLIIENNEPHDPELQVSLYTWEMISNCVTITEPIPTKRHINIFRSRDNESRTDDEFAVEGPESEQWQPLLGLGRFLFVNRYQSIERNDLMLIRLKNGNLRFGLLQRRTAVRILLRQLPQADKILEIDSRAISWMIRVVGLLAHPFVEVVEHDS